MPLATLEDLAIASVAYPLLAETLGISATTWNSVVDRWHALRRACASGYRPFRLQPLLIDMLEVLRANRVETLSRWQVSILLKAMELAGLLGPGSGAVFREAMLPYENDLRMLADHHGAIYDISNAAVPIRYVTAKEIATSRPREVKTVAGIDIGFVGPLLSNTGTVKVLDSIPDGCTLVVESGSCLINGYVFGRVIASDACHVGRNVSGTIIVRQGNITADGVFRRAFVVTKNGALECRTTEDPILMFAGAGIDVAERTVSGVYAGPRIRVGQEVYGGKYALSDRMTAPKIRCDSDRPVSIFLQRAMMPEDYGELLGHDARHLTIQWVKLRQQLLAAERLVGVTEEEIERTAASAIWYLLGGELVQKELEEVRQAERRLVFLERLITGLDTINENLETRPAAAAGDDAEGELDAGWEEVAEVWAGSEDSTESSETDAQWAQEKEALAQLSDTLQGPKAQTRVQDTLFRWSEKKLEWVRERNALLSSVERKRADLKRLMGRAEHVGSLDLTLSKQRQLAVLLESLRGRNAHQDWAERAGKPFMRVLLRNIASLRNRATYYTQVVPGLRDQLRALSDKLKTDFSIRLDLDDTRLPPRVTAQFDAGVKIYARRFREPDSAKDVYFSTPAGRETARTYLRDANSIVDAGDAKAAVSEVINHP